MSKPFGLTESLNWSNNNALLAGLALGSIVLHVLTNGNYGFHRDELATLYDGRGMAWGYVAYPPMTPFLGHVSVGGPFGTSLNGFRFFSALANGLSIFFTGLMARELGGGWHAQSLAALATMPFCLGAGAIMHYISFDYLFWVMTVYFFIRLLRSNDSRWWLAVGGAIGLGMLAKYTMLFLVLGTIFGVLVTDARCYLKSKWLWWGVGVSALVFLPNFVWQVQHHFITIDFLRKSTAAPTYAKAIRARFFLFQLKATLLAFPFSIAGFFVSLSEIPPLLPPTGLDVSHAAYAFCRSAGAGPLPRACVSNALCRRKRLGEKWIASLRRPWNARVRAVAWTGLLADVLFASAVGLPIAPLGTSWWKVASGLQGEYPEQLGWPELVETLAQIRDSLPPEQRAHRHPCRKLW